MTNQQLRDLLREARIVLEHVALIDDEDCRDDVAEICQKIDEAISNEADEADAAA
jgi:hypothetical protein